MKVMGHRGAAGLALENTLDSFEIAKLLNVDSIELDLRITKDNELVVVHDHDLKRVSNSTLSIKDSTLADIQSVTLSNGHSIVPTLTEVLDATAEIPLVIEIKSSGCIDKLLALLKHYDKRDITIASFKHGELAKIRKRAPQLKLYGLEHTKPIEIIQLTRSLRLDGIGLNFWLLNPLTYWLCRRSKLEIYVYTINNRFIANIVNTLYPQVVICTDFPERLVKNRNTSMKPTKDVS